MRAKRTFVWSALLLLSVGYAPSALGGQEHPFSALLRPGCACVFVPVEVLEDGSARGACRHASEASCPEGEFLLSFLRATFHMATCPNKAFKPGEPMLVRVARSEAGWSTLRCGMYRFLPSDKEDEVVEAVSAAAGRNEEQVFGVITRTTSPTALVVSVLALLTMGNGQMPVPVVRRLETVLRRPEMYKCDAPDCGLVTWENMSSLTFQLLEQRREAPALLRLARDVGALSVTPSDAYLERLVHKLGAACHIELKPAELRAYVAGLAERLGRRDDHAVSCAALRGK